MFEAIRRVMAERDPDGAVVPYLVPGFTDSKHYAKTGATCYGFYPMKLLAGMVFSDLAAGRPGQEVGVLTHGPMEGFDFLWVRCEPLDLQMVSVLDLFEQIVCFGMVQQRVDKEDAEGALQAGGEVNDDDAGFLKAGPDRQTVSVLHHGVMEQFFGVHVFEVAWVEVIREGHDLYPTDIGRSRRPFLVHLVYFQCV